MKIETIIFDVGNVLIDTHTSVARNQLCRECGISQADFEMLGRSDFQGSHRSVTEMAILGQIAEQEYLDAFKRYCRAGVPTEFLRQNRLSVVGSERVRMVQLLKQLRSRYRICVFTNTIELHWNHIVANSSYTFLRQTDCVFASHLIGFGKPQAEGFEFVLSKLGNLESRVLFIDDLEINTRAAKMMGMNVVLFESIDSMSSQLNSLGI